MPALSACRKLKLSAGARAELSPLQATLGSDGRLTAERLDVRIKTGKVHASSLSDCTLVINGWAALISSPCHILLA